MLRAVRAFGLEKVKYFTRYFSPLQAVLPKLHIFLPELHCKKAARPNGGNAKAGGRLAACFKKEETFIFCPGISGTKNRLLCPVSCARAPRALCCRPFRKINLKE